MSKDQNVTRKLRAILSADVKGYSLLMSDDEAFTVKTLKEYRAVMSEQIELNTGRVVDAPGDNLLAEFASVVDAVECAVEIQKILKEKNEDLPEDKRLEFRIGINIGDVIQDGDSLYGEGVNIAARIEGLADAGGVCISRNAYDHIRNKMNLGYEYLGEHSVKNIKNPVRVYKILMAAEDAGKLIGEKSQRFKIKWPGLTVAVVSVIVGIIAWQFYYEKSTPIEAASVENMAFPLPDKPSIAVLPFVNMSNDPDQEYFSDGITEDLITDLSQISGLFVISRNSTFIYKGKPTKIRQVAEDLGVRYVLEGSVRKVENTVRINAQLIDATTGGHLWSERYDEEMDNIFTLQDMITQKIAEALAVKLLIDEKQTIPKKDTDNLEAYLTFLKGWQYYRQFSPDDFIKAISLFEKAIELDPHYWRAYAALAKIYMEVYIEGRTPWRKRLGLSRSENQRLINKYLTTAMNGPTPIAHEVATQMHIKQADFEGAMIEAEKAVSLNPNAPLSHFAMGQALLHTSRHRDAAESFKRAMRFDPFYQDRYGYGLGMAYFFILRFEKAVDLFERAYKSNPEDISILWFLAATYGQLGRVDEAEATLAEMWKL